MSKLFVAALLFYNIAAISCIALEDDDKSYRAEPKFDLPSLRNAFANKGLNLRDIADDSLENWTGRWMPSQPGEPSLPPKIWPAAHSDREGSHHNPMGETSNCDDGKTNLSVDWDYSPVNYTCYGYKITPSKFINALRYKEKVPPMYTAGHRCMNESIQYQNAIPVYGTHRPSWPVYGEYKFLPRQRWLHSLEHGAVVMLYHPCANPQEIELLKTLVTNCLRRHIISPYNLVDRHRPLVLVTWGSRLSMSYVNRELVKNFIRTTALRGPEKISESGTFADQLLSESRNVSDHDDTNLCPNI